MSEQTSAWPRVPGEGHTVHTLLPLHAPGSHVWLFPGQTWFVDTERLPAIGFFGVSGTFFNERYLGGWLGKAQKWGCFYKLVLPRLIVHQDFVWIISTSYLSGAENSSLKSSGSSTDPRVSSCHYLSSLTFRMGLETQH